MSLTLTFDIDTVIDSYTIDYHQTFASATFQLSGANGTSNQNALYTIGTLAFDMGTIPYFAAGQPYALTHTVINSGDVFSLLAALDVSAPTPSAPAPGTALLLADGLIGLQLLRRHAREPDRPGD